MKLIDADARVIVQSFDDEHEEYCHTEMSIAEALDFFTDEGCPPAVNAAPVVYGTWGRYYDGYNCTEYIVCSNCGAKYDSDIVFAYHNGEPRLELEGLEHCPHCGAKMDGGENDARQ